MNRKIKFILPLIACFSLAGCEINFKGFKKKTTEETIISKNKGFYKDYDLDLTGAFLEEELQKLCFEKHKNYVLYNQYNGYCLKKNKGKNAWTNSIEAVSDGSNINQYFYTGKEASGYGTREHVWPCANSANLWVHDGSSNQNVHNVDYSQYVGGGSDLFHVRTANTTINTARGNSKFVDFDDPEFEDFRSGVYEKGETNGKYKLKLFGGSAADGFANKCEPADEMKGDVARIIVYVWIHYGTHGYVPEGEVVNGGHVYKLSDMIGSLSLSNIFGYDSDARCIQEIVEWNNLDKPSEVEKLRNNTVQGIQGNRNPFVDFPELIDQLFDDYI